MNYQIKADKHIEKTLLVGKPTLLKMQGSF
jgi:hypothetical protein